jgi:hypothetical protein
MKWLDAGDRLAKKYVLDRLPIIDPGEPRSLRWLPLLILVAVTVGYGLIVSLPGRGQFGAPVSALRIATVIVAAMLFFGGFSMANWIQFFGPRLGTRFGGETLDERELAIRARAFAISGSIIAWFAVLGCFWIGLAPFVGGWRPQTLLDWMYLGMGLEAWLFTLPVLIASWLQPREAPDLGE